MAAQVQLQLQLAAHRPSSCPPRATQNGGPNPRHATNSSSNNSRSKRHLSKRPVIRRRGTSGMSSSASTPPASSSSIPPEGASRLPDVQPCFGQLVHLPTRAEAQAILTLSDAYVLEVPVKGANDILMSVHSLANSKCSPWFLQANLSQRRGQGC